MARTPTENLSFDEAMAAAKKGYRVRVARMSKGWTIAWFMLKGVKGGGDYFCINPHTGSNYHYAPNEVDKLSKKWSIHS